MQLEHDFVKRLTGFARLASALFLLVALSACQTIKGPDRASMSMGFVEAVYGVGIEPVGQDVRILEDGLHRWDKSQPVKLVIIGVESDDELYQAIEREMRALYRIAGVRLSTSDVSTSHRLRVEVRNVAMIVSNKIKAPCYTQYDESEGGNLLKVEVVVTRASIERPQYGCLLHEGMHSLGFGGHPHRLDSLLSYTQDIDHLTETDRQLIKMLYSNDLDRMVEIDIALTTAYSKFYRHRLRTDSGPTPTDISLQLREEESPLTLAAPLLEDASKQFYYDLDAASTSSINAAYGLRGDSDRFANLNYVRRTTSRLFGYQATLADLAKTYESNLGTMIETGSGESQQPTGRFDYLLAEMDDLSCVFLLRRETAASNATEGQQYLSGFYCGDKSSPMRSADADDFAAAIRLHDRDPVKVRGTQLAGDEDSARNFAAIRVTGSWPVNGSRVVGLKLADRGDLDGVIKITVNGEICGGVLSRIDGDGLGKWRLKCELNESANGQFSEASEGRFVFRGETSASKLPIEWEGYPVL